MLNRRRLLMATLAAAGTSQWLSSARAAAPRLPVTASATEGPYYLSQSPDRADIREGAAGEPLDLQLRVMDVQAQRLGAVRVDVWHCDAQGNYSGFDDRNDSSGRARRYLRGTQRTNAEGDVHFRTIWPGWYPGRTTHIHFKVIRGDRTLLTSQLYLPDALNQQLYSTASAYFQRRRRETLNSNDRIALAGGDSQMAAVSETAGGSLARLDVVVRG
jgi:protocatechuate 3,4-dioxygenase beta subunit